MGLSDAECVRRREEALQRTLDSLGESVASIAHDIRNPRTAVSMALRAVAEKLGEDQEAVLHDLVRRLDGVEFRLRRALALSTPLEPAATACDLGPLLASVAVQGTAIEDVCGCSPVLADAALLEEALGHLVDNAVRAAPGRVSLRANAVDDGGQRIRIEVEDAGPGVSDVVKAVAFQPFFTTDDGRCGLGLAIAKRIVEAHGGTIGLDDVPGGGTRAWIELPAA